MDETLAELYPMYYFVASLRLKETVAGAEEISPQLLNSLDKAYNTFINTILKEETSTKPLGILRPGILNVMMKLYELQKSGKLNSVVIYSNNGHLESLEFIRDLIHKHLGTTKLIKECIHWNHHMRNEERFRMPGAANKTWNVIKNIMVNGVCDAPSNLEPKTVYFFDDLNHPDLKTNLGDNYYKVPGYNFKASFERIALIYKKAILESNVNITEYMDYIVDLFVDNSNKHLMGDDNSDIDTIINIFKSKTSGTSSETELPLLGDDTGINMMMDAIRRVSLKGGRRKRMSNNTIRKKKRKMICQHKMRPTRKN